MSTVTIAIQSYKNPEMLKVCLDSVLVDSNKNKWEVVVADGQTQIDTRLMMREDYPNVTFLPHKKNVGFGAMVNACIDACKTEYIFLINADTIMNTDAIETLQRFMDEHTDIGLVGPAQKNFNNQPENTRFRFYELKTIFYRRTFLGQTSFGKKHLRNFSMADVVSNSPHPVSWVIGSAMFVRMKALVEVGNMDSRFFMYMEDVDWCRRFWEKGWKVYYNPKCTIHHFYGKGSAKGGVFANALFNRLTWIHISSAVKYFIKYQSKQLPGVAPSEFLSQEK